MSLEPRVRPSRCGDCVEHMLRRGEARGQPGRVRTPPFSASCRGGHEHEGLLRGGRAGRVVVAHDGHYEADEVGAEREERQHRDGQLEARGQLRLLRAQRPPAPGLYQVPALGGRWGAAGAVSGTEGLSAGQWLALTVYVVCKQSVDMRRSRAK